jgi:hypothetical protein
VNAEWRAMVDVATLSGRVVRLNEQLGADRYLVVRVDVGHASACPAVVDHDDFIDSRERTVET